jgi:tripartite-type tricarboxylate transporter receptor subunit TctC
VIACAIALLSIFPARAQAPYPSHPIRIVVPFGPGGFADITVRLLGQKLTERTAAQVVIENRPGAGGIVAASSVIASAPDGYTLFVFSSGIALSKSLLMKDALETARRDPQKFNVGTINPGSTQNVTGELLRSATGIAMTVVPHRTSADVLTSLLRGDIQIGVDAYAALKSAIDAKSIRAIASSGSKRSPQQPDVPTLRELGLDATVDGWNSLVAPSGTPKEIIAFLNNELRAIINDTDFRTRMIELGGEPATCSPEELDARLKSDVEMWAGVVKKAGLEPN